MKKVALLLAAGCMLTACHESLEERAAREAQEFTMKNCPTPPRDNIRTDSLTYEAATRTLCYWHTLCGPADKAQNIEDNKERLIQTLRDGVKSSTQLKAYKDAGFNVRYTYHSEKSPKEILLQATFTPKDY